VKYVAEWNDFCKDVCMEIFCEDRFAGQETDKSQILQKEGRWANMGRGNRHLGLQKGFLNILS
jgi:hypothetical protein